MGISISDGRYEKKPSSLCRALHFVQKSESRRMYPPGNKPHFCRRERFECKADGWVGQKCGFLGTAGGHAAVLTNLAGSVLADSHGAAVFTLLT